MTMDYETWENDPKYQNFWRRLIDIFTERRWDHRIKEIGEDEPCQWGDGLLPWKLNLQWKPMVSVFDSLCQISEKSVF